MMLGFEILLSGLAIVLAFVWVSVSEGPGARGPATPMTYASRVGVVSCLP